MLKKHREKFILGKENLQEPAPCGNHQREQGEELKEKYADEGLDED